ncbi:FAD-binding oxidoreductase [Dactylosporangium sp. CS-047395]|uniref:FAD-binding oxidoreductase n=1 Tax=Dactylosporangium sp. CS-047395 TaxID=3239936 RepID=UPI003D9250F5
MGVITTGHQHSVPVDGGLMISTRAMQQVLINAEQRTARVEAGVRWGQVVPKAAKAGLAPLNGSTGGVGVVGYTVGGGLSPTLGRALGYADDHVTSLDVVTADGQLRTATATTEKDLFFAVRGGKSNFGIVTAVEFRLFPVQTLYAGNLFFPGELAKDVLNAYRTWVATVPEAMSSSVALMRIPPLPSAPEPLRGRFVVTVRIAYAGSALTGADLVKPLRAIGPMVLDTVTEIPYTDFASIHADPVDPVPAYERTALLRELSAATVDELVAVAGPGAAVPLTMVELRHLGGALARPPAVPNAVSNRDAAFTLFTAGVGAPADTAAITRQQDELIRRMRPWSTGQTYLNFLSSADATAEQVRTAFIPETYNRLVQLKQQYDPTNMFRLNHNIKPA